MFLGEKETRKKYSFLWSKYQNFRPLEEYHFNSMSEVIPEEIVRGKIGLDLGCGCGWDTLIMAKNNPGVRIVGVDISDGVHNAGRITRHLDNVTIIKGSAANIPLQNESCDFVYSFGVLHHMCDYKNGLLEIRRVLKKYSPCFLYLYEDHAENRIKYTFLKMVALFRKITVRLPPEVLYVFALSLSPLIVLIFAYPARFFKRFPATRKLYEKMPFNFGDSLFSVSGDLYDRFSTPIEHRFGQQELQDLFKRLRFGEVRITKLKATAGWVVRGIRTDD
jgi:ubiquinone/menaquinone biosynthesis C-methylase UbiE